MSALLQPNFVPLRRFPIPIQFSFSMWVLTSQLRKTTVLAFFTATQMHRQCETCTTVREESDGAGHDHRHATPLHAAPSSSYKYDNKRYNQRKITKTSDHSACFLQTAMFNESTMRNSRPVDSCVEGSNGSALCLLWLIRGQHSATSVSTSSVCS